MKKLLALAAIAVMLTGCDMSRESVRNYENKCFAQNGEPIYYKTSSGTVWKVRCKIDGIVYLMGDYE